MQWWCQPDLPTKKELGMTSACFVVMETTNVLFNSLLCHLIYGLLEHLMSPLIRFSLPRGCCNTDLFVV